MTNSDSVDLFLVAANNALREAEMLHNFEYTRCEANLNIDALNGGALSAATITDSNARFDSVREVVAVMRQRPDGTYIPLDFSRADLPIERDRTELEFSDNLFSYLRYPSDAQINARGTNSAIVQRGTTLYVYPRYTAGVTTAFACLLSGYAWMKEYVVGDLSTANVDFFVQYGHSYLQWAIICELNYVFQAFVPRQEGNPGAPEKMKADAWQKLLDWDSYMVDSNSTRSR